MKVARVPECLALREVAHWPTPGAGGFGGTSGRWNALKRNCASMDEARKMGAGNGGKLNADWVDRLMGYPDQWTDIDAGEVAAVPPYPEAWLDGSWDTIPRIVAEQKQRRVRLKCLGNAVVPQISALLWRLITGVF